MNHRLFLTLCAAAALVPAGLYAQPRRVVLQGAINEPGQYVLPSDLQVVPSRGAGIMITASGVDLDMNGASLTGPGGVMGTGIHVRGASGVTIRNGKFANRMLQVNHSRQIFQFNAVFPKQRNGRVVNIL